MKARHLPLLACVCALLLGSLAATADARTRPPDLVLKTTGVRQEGNLGSYCWQEGTQGGCYVTFGFAWPSLQAAEAGDKARVVIKYSGKPTGLALDYWRSVDGDGNPEGESRSLEYRLEAGTVRGKKVWIARFRLPGTEGHFYMRAFGQWKQGDGFYDFHLDLH